MSVFKKKPEGTIHRGPDLVFGMEAMENTQNNYSCAFAFKDKPCDRMWSMTASLTEIWVLSILSILGPKNSSL